MNTASTNSVMHCHWADCIEEFVNPKEYLEHIGTHLIQKPWVCEWQGYVFAFARTKFSELLFCFLFLHHFSLFFSCFCFLLIFRVFLQTVFLYPFPLFRCTRTAPFDYKSNLYQHILMHAVYFLVLNVLFSELCFTLTFFLNNRNIVLMSAVFLNVAMLPPFLGHFVNTKRHTNGLALPVDLLSDRSPRVSNPLH